MMPSDSDDDSQGTRALPPWLRRLLLRRERFRDAPKAHRSREDAEQALDDCLRECVGPALAAVRDTLNEEGYACALEEGERSFCLRAVRDNEHFCVLRAEGRLYHKPSFAFPALHGNPERPLSARMRLGCEGNEREWQLQHCNHDSVYQFALHECRKWVDW